MDGLNIITLSYLFFRLAPFIIVCYFSLSSIFNQDIKGLIYLGGLMIACVFGVILGNLFGSIPEDAGAVCNMITIGNNGSFSKIPLGIVMLSYTFFYLLYIMITYNVQNNNIPTIVLFSMLIAGDIVWNFANKCYNPFGILGSLLIGGLFGYIWGIVIDSIGKPNLLYLNIGNDKTVCSRPSSQLYKCTFSGNQSSGNQSSTATSATTPGSTTRSAFTTMEGYSNINNVKLSDNKKYKNVPTTTIPTTSIPTTNVGTVDSITTPNITSSITKPLVTTQVPNVPLSINDAINQTNNLFTTTKLDPNAKLEDVLTYQSNLIEYINMQNQLKGLMTPIPINNSIILQNAN